MKYTIFVERIFDDDVFIKLCDFVSRNECHLYCTTPANYELAKAEQGYQGSKAHLSKIMAKRYRQLEILGKRPIQLHLHLSLRPEKMKQQKIFSEAVKWMDKNGFHCTEVEYGWYLSSEESRFLEKAFKLRHINRKWSYHLHDFEIDKPVTFFRTLQNVRNWTR